MRKAHWMVALAATGIVGATPVLAGIEVGYEPAFLAKAEQAVVAGDPARAIALIEARRGWLKSADLIARACRDLAAAYYLTGDHPRARAEIERALATGEAGPADHALRAAMIARVAVGE